MAIMTPTSQGKCSGRWTDIHGSLAEERKDDGRGIDAKGFRRIKSRENCAPRKGSETDPETQLA